MLDRLLRPAARRARRPLAVGAIALLAAAPVAAVASASPSQRAGVTGLPAVTGGFGQRPKLTFPSTPPPSRLVVDVLHRGHGTVVRKGDLLVVNYYGQSWRGKVFDTSFGRGLFATPIGVGQVIPGWDRGLVGTRVGSRVLLSVPPKDGYGVHPSGGRPGGTLEFVIDVAGAYGRGAHGDPHATVLHHQVGPVRVGGRLGGEPTVAVRKGAPAPRRVEVVLVARGHGPKVRPGLLVEQYVARTWTNGSTQSSWVSLPAEQAVGDPSAPTLFDKTIGMPLGSRVLFELPKAQGSGPFAVVVDLVAEPKG